MMAKRKFLSIILTLVAFSYFCIVLCTVGQMCFKLSPTSLETPFSDDLQKRSESEADASSYYDNLRRLQTQKRSQNEAHANVLTNPGYPKEHKSQKQKQPDFDDSEVESQFYHRNLVDPRRPFFNCSTISRMKIRSKIGHGVAKETFLAEFEGTRVAIKMVTRRIHLVRRCLDKVRGAQASDKAETMRPSPNEELNMRMDEESDERKKEVDECYVKPTARLMKEILLSLQLRHHNLISLLGFCVRSEESETTDIAEHGVIGVYELGHRFLLDNLQILPWQAKLGHALEMADLLAFLHHSPLGSLLVPDLTEGNLVMVGDSIKLVDLDDVHAQEPECHVVNGTESSCPLGTVCSRALCEGYNARSNLRLTNQLIFKRLLFPLSFPESVVTRLGRLNAQLDSLTLTAVQLREELWKIKASLKGYDTL